MDHPVARSLIVGKVYSDLSNGSLVIPANDCFCLKWLKSRGSTIEQKIANALQWFAFGLSVLILIYYAYATWKTTCGWEEVYVCCVELSKVVIEFFHEFDAPSMLYLSNGNRVLWLRYAEWLLTCPVILIHLSNLTGLKDDYNKRTMRLLVSDIGTIVWGTTAAMSTGYVKVIFFLMGVLYGANTFFHAAKVYIEAYHTVPKGLCRQVVRVMAWLFFASWGMFPVMFLLGPEGFGHIGLYGSTIGHTVIDLLSKNCWGLLGNFLRVKIHEHILLYGDIRKVQKIKVAGQELEVETMMTEEATDTIKKPTAQYASRDSFLNMRDKLKERGFEVRASLDNSAINDAIQGGSGGDGNNNPNPNLLMFKPGMERGKLDLGGGNGGVMNDSDAANAAPSSLPNPGRVILAVPDISMVDYFREQFAQLPVPYEVVPALGADNTVQLIVQAAALGGCDFVLLHPEFLRDKSANALPIRLRSMGQRVAAFGWSSMGPVRDLIESAGLDGWLEGPSFGSGISLSNLVNLVVRMQQARKMAAMMGMQGMGIMGGGGNPMGGAGNGMGGMGMMGNAGASGLGGMNMGMGMMNAGLGTQLSANGRGGAGGGVGMTGGAGSHQTSAGGLGGSYATPFQVGSNPLFNTAPSPLSSQPGDANATAITAASGMTGAFGGGMQSANSVRNSGLLTSTAGASASGGLQLQMMSTGSGVGPNGGGAASEAEMLHQLMAEINRLKNELGESELK